MKKQYEKPIAELVIFEMNDVVASCTADITENLSDYSCIKDEYAGIITFVQDSDCENPKDYCYYTSVNILAQS